MSMTSTPPPARWHPNDTLRGIMYMLIAVNMFPFMNIMVKVLSTDHATVQLVWARYFGHFLFVILLFLPRRGLSLFVARRPVAQICRSSLLFGSTICFFFGLNYISVPTASMINFTAPLIATVLAIPLLGEKVGPRRLLAVMAGLVGAAIILRPGGEEAHWAMFVGLASATCYAGYQLLTRWAAGGDNAETAITYTAVVGTVVTSIALPWFWTTPDGLVDLAMFIAIGCIGGTGHFFVIRAFQHAEVSIITPFNYAQLVIAVILTYWIYGDLPSAASWLGAAIIVASGIYITLRESRAAR